MLRLKRREDFLAARAGRRANMATLTLQMRARGDADAARAGFTVTKKTGGSVVRNRIRRRLREALRRVDAAARPGHDYVLIGREAALRAPFDVILSDLTAAFDRVHQGRGRGDARSSVAAGDASS